MAILAQEVSTKQYIIGLEVVWMKILKVKIEVKLAKSGHIYVVRKYESHLAILAQEVSI